jgi:hypothetical protein
MTRKRWKSRVVLIALTPIYFVIAYWLMQRCFLSSLDIYKIDPGMTRADAYASLGRSPDTEKLEYEQAAKIWRTYDGEIHIIFDDKDCVKTSYRVVPDPVSLSRIIDEIWTRIKFW